MSFCKSKILSAACVLSLSATMACSKSKEVAGETASKVQLQGLYQAQLKSEVGVLVKGVGCVVQDVRFEANSTTLTQVVFSGPQCDGVALGKIITETSSDVGPELPLAPGARALDLTINKITITVLDQGWNEIFGIDASGACDLSQQPLNQPREVTGLDCGVLGKYPAKDAVYFTSYALDKDVFTFTAFPQDASEHIGTKALPKDRNQKLVTQYFKK